MSSGRRSAGPPEATAVEAVSCSAQIHIYVPKEGLHGNGPRRPSGASGVLLTLKVVGDCGRISKVEKEGAPVSPALISPPNPLDFLRCLGIFESLCLLFPFVFTDRGINLSRESGGKGSVPASDLADMLMVF